MTDTVVLFETPTLEVLWDESARTLHKRIGIAMSPPLASEPFWVVGKLGRGVVIRAHLHGRERHLLVRPGDLHQIHKTELSQLRPLRGFAALMRELLASPFPKLSSPSLLGFNPEGWYGLGAPGYVAPEGAWTPVLDGQADASVWLGWERLEDDMIARSQAQGRIQASDEAYLMARWGALMRKMRQMALADEDQGYRVVNAVGDRERQAFLVMLLRAAVGQLQPSHVDDSPHNTLDQLIAPAQGQGFQAGLRQMPGWWLPVRDTVGSRILLTWCNYPQRPMVQQNQASVRQMVIGDTPIAPKNPGRAGAQAWATLQASILIWELPPVPSRDTWGPLMGQLATTCPAADPAFQIV